MAAPSVSTSSPVDGAVDVFINDPITVTFAAALDSDTVNGTTVSLLDVSTNTLVQIDLEYITSKLQVKITPLSALAENTVYKVRFPGTDVSLGPDYVIKDNASGDPLATTITITFTTGERVNIDDSSIDKDATDLSLEGDLVLPVHVKALGVLAVETTWPKNHTADVATGLLGGSKHELYIKFNKELSGSLCDNSWLSVDAFPMLDETQFLASGETLNAGTIPAVTGLACSGNYLWAGFASPIPNNVGVHITISTGVVASDGSEFGPSEYVLAFTTDRYPKVSGPHHIKRQLLPIHEELQDEYIAALLFEKTLMLDQMIGVGQPVSYLGLRWVLLSTMIEILDDKELEKALVAGARRQLGDLLVSHDPLIGKMSLKRARLADELEKVERALGGKSILAKVYNVTLDVAKPDRLWHGVHGKLLHEQWKTFQANIPAANVAVNRQAKVNPDSYWWQ